MIRARVTIEALEWEGPEKPAPVVLEGAAFLSCMVVAVDLEVGEGEASPNWFGSHDLLNKLWIVLGRRLGFIQPRLTPKPQGDLAAAPGELILRPNRN